MAFSVLLFLLVWEVFSRISGSDFLLPGPVRVMADLYVIFTEADFLPVVMHTLGRYMAGFALAFMASILIGIPAGFSGTFYLFFRPVLVVFRSVPVISFILLALIWFTSQSVPVFISFITMFPIICISIIDGIRQIDRRYFELGQVFGIRRSQQIHDVVLPAISSFLFSGMATALGFGWRAVIIGEVLSQPEFGIGTEMQKSHIYLMISYLLAWTVVAVLVSYLLELGIRAMEKKLFKWKAYAQD